MGRVGAPALAVATRRGALCTPSAAAASAGKIHTGVVQDGAFQMGDDIDTLSTAKSGVWFTSDLTPSGGRSIRGMQFSAVAPSTA